MIVWIAALALALDAPDLSRIEADLATLVDGEFASRHIEHPDHQAAGDWLLGRFAEIDGLQVSVETFSAAGRDDLRNIVADLPGTDPDLPWLVVGAHWDSSASGDVRFDATVDTAPGADDDASGCVAVLEIARLMAALDWQRSVRFVLFDAEEQGLLGSAKHAQGMVAAGLDVEQMWTLDPIGYNAGGANNLWVTYDARWPEAANYLEDAEVEDLLVTAVDRDLIGGGGRSDHASFWAEDLPAVHVASWPQPPSYHTSGDTLDNVDMAFTTRVVGLISTQVAELALPAESVEETGCGCVSSSRSFGLWWVLLPMVMAKFRR